MRRQLCNGGIRVARGDVLRFFFSAASAIVGEFGKVWRMSADCSEYYKADEIGLIAVMS